MKEAIINKVQPGKIVQITSSLSMFNIFICNRIFEYVSITIVYNIPDTKPK